MVFLLRPVHSASLNNLRKSPPSAVQASTVTGRVSALLRSVAWRKHRPVAVVLIVNPASISDCLEGLSMPFSVRTCLKHNVLIKRSRGLRKQEKTDDEVITTVPYQVTIAPFY